MALNKLNPFSKMSALKIGQMKKWTENNAINAYVTINSWIFVAVRKIANFIIKMLWNKIKKQNKKQSFSDFRQEHCWTEYILAKCGMGHLNTVTYFL